MTGPGRGTGFNARKVGDRVGTLRALIVCGRNRQKVLAGDFRSRPVSCVKSETEDVQIRRHEVSARWSSLYHRVLGDGSVTTHRKVGLCEDVVHSLVLHEGNDSERPRGLEVGTELHRNRSFSSLRSFRRHAVPYYRRSPRIRKAFAITETELKLIAAAAIIGLSNNPKSGYRTPAATGTPRAL